MLKINVPIFRKKEPTLEETVKKSDLNPEVKKLLLGKSTVFSILSFIIGGVLVGSTLWTVTVELMGIWFTFIFGLVLFLAGGIFSKAFRK